MSPKISIIIPAYNIADYIEKTLNSVFQQTYKNIEIIVVDDGSTDDTYGVCKRFADFNSNFDIQVIHKENGGVSSARNEGILAAKGDYICFVDGDDLVSSNMVQELYNIIGLCDMSTCGHDNKKSSKIQRFIMDSKTALTELCNNKVISYSAWAKLYKTKICKEILFDCNTGILEDFLFVSEYISRIEKICITNEALYYYVKRDDSALGKPFSHKRLELIYSYKKAIDIVKKKFPEVVPYYNCSFFVELIELNLRMPKNNEFENDRKKVMLEINSLRKEKLKGILSKLIKIRMFKISPLLYNVVMKAYRNLRAYI